MTMTRDEIKKILRGYFNHYPEVILKLNYAMARFVKSEIGLKTEQKDPRVFFSAKLIQDRDEIAIHLRMPLKDKWNNLLDFLDIDIYFPTGEIEKINRLLQIT